MCLNVTKKRSEEYVIDDQIMLMLPRCCLRFVFRKFPSNYYLLLLLYYYNYILLYRCILQILSLPPHPVDMIPLFPFVQKRKKMNIFPSNSNI